MSRMARVWQRLQQQPLATTVISIAGTNGKGTCAHFLERSLRAQGRRTGLYTSPHLLRFNERFRIDGIAVDDLALCAAFERVEQARGGEALTFFEFTTLAGLTLFEQAKLDVVILEVGLGGRLDAVNVVDADVAIVTRIGIDHTEYLGDTRDAIAHEKAGIFRPDCPAIVADPQAPATLAAHARRVGALLYERNTEFFLRAGRPRSVSLARPVAHVGLADPSARGSTHQLCRSTEGARLFGRHAGRSGLARSIGSLAIAGAIAVGARRAELAA